MKMSNEVLTIFPTELAKRRTERRWVLEAGAIDTSRLTTQKKLLALCERAARQAGLLTGRVPGEAELRLLLDDAAASVHFVSGQPLAGLSSAARAGLLRQLINTFAFLSENESALTQWLLAHEEDHKLHGLGRLLDAWNALCTKMDIADRFAINRALLQFMKEGELPSELESEIHFRAVRWFNPFEERFVAALKTRLGPERVKIFPVLPAAHAEAAEERLCAVVRGEMEHGNEEEWQVWMEDFADAFETDDSNLIESESSERVCFFTSAHPYGEIEDAARRIAHEIEAGTAPDQIGLILRDLSPYTDIIPDVFQRFGIPYYFRRGMPAAAHPPVKALLALLAFPKTHSRDRLCDLLLMPGIDWPGVEDREALVQKIRKNEPPRLFRLPREVAGFFSRKELSFSEQTNALIEQHNLKLPEEVHTLIQELNEAPLHSLPTERLISLFEELLDNRTLHDEFSSENGVWVINPMDAAGLWFESVFVAGMDDRTFPQIPTADSLLNKTERKMLRAFLEERRILCPRLALSESNVALIQEEILFLTAIGTAKERLTLSYTRIDAEGKERAAGGFFERMIGLTQPQEAALGKSFHSILPPEAIRAEDEARQTNAWMSRNADAMSPHLGSVREFRNVSHGSFLNSRTDPENEVRQTNAWLNPSPATIQQSIIPNPALQKWLKDHPEFSATALESLARNRFVFFLEKVLGIKPDRTHEDRTDPMDRGTLVHDILEKVYIAIAEQSDLYADNSSGAWKIAQRGDIPLAVFDPANEKEIISLAREIADEEFAKAEQRPSRHLGHPAVWETEKRKLHQVIENFIRMDLDTALKENRYPALFEMKFDEKHDLPLTLHYTQGSTQGSVRESCIENDTIPRTDPIRSVRLKGKIDRIDLIFGDDGELKRLLVVDYKGKSRNDSIETLEKKIGLNLDCQLALYTFAAQEKFFGAHNTPELNEKTAAVYHLQERELKKMTRHFSKKRLTMTSELTDSFLETLFSNVRKFSNGDLAVEPLIKGYEDYSHICRTREIDLKELLK